MIYTRLNLIVEGDDDERLVKAIIPANNLGYMDVFIWKYRQASSEKTNLYLKTIKSTSGWNYLFFSDLDDNPCILGKKTKVCAEFSELDADHIVVVAKEIESWYAAGINNVSSKKPRVSILRDTNRLCKEEFAKLCPPKQRLIEYKLDIMANFSIETAKNRNRSFKYLMDKKIPSITINH